MMLVIDYIRYCYREAREEGRTNAQIARDLGISERTIYNYKTRGII